MSARLPNPTDKYVGSRVRLLRNQHNMSQEMLAKHLGMSFQQVQKYEKGINRVSASRLRHLGQIFDVQVSFFFKGAPRIAGPARKNEAIVSPDDISAFVVGVEGKALARAFLRITDATVRRSVVRMVEALAESSKR
jgi:transcriptional regulator with XRE-family HTH domain